MRGRGRDAGQATIEFALVVGLFLLLLLPIIDAGLWAVQSDDAVSATEAGVQIAAEALGQDPTASVPATAAVFAKVSGSLASAGFGTSFAQWSPARGCPSAKAVAEHFGGVGTLNVCAELTSDATGRQYATVRISGFARSLVPPSLGLSAWTGGGMPIDEQSSMYVETFANAG